MTITDIPKRPYSPTIPEPVENPRMFENLIMPILAPEHDLPGLMPLMNFLDEDDDFDEVLPNDPIDEELFNLTREDDEELD